MTANELAYKRVKAEIGKVYMVSKVVVSDKKALSNLREHFETLSKVALAAKSECGRSG